MRLAHHARAALLQMRHASRSRQRRRSAWQRYRLSSRPPAPDKDAQFGATVAQCCAAASPSDELEWNLE